MTTFSKPLLLVVLTIGFTGLAWSQVKVGDPAPDLVTTTSLNTDHGGPISLADLRGQVVMIDFWATWCGPCVASIPKLNDWHKQYAERGLVILGHTDGSSKSLPDFINKHQIQYQITIGPDIGNAYGVTGIPALFVIDPTGNIAWSGHPGRFDPALLEELLAGVEPPGPSGPSFSEPSTHEHIQQIQEGMSKGHVGKGLRLLERLSRDQDEQLAAAAQKTIAEVEAWQQEQTTQIEELTTSGDVYAAWKLSEQLSEMHTGHRDSQSLFRDRARELRRADDWRAGEAFSKLTEIPEKHRSDPRYTRMIEDFQRRYGDSYYAQQLNSLTFD